MNVFTQQKIYYAPCYVCPNRSVATGFACQGHDVPIFPMPNGPGAVAGTIPGATHSVYIAPVTEQRAREIAGERIRDYAETYLEKSTQRSAEDVVLEKVAQKGSRLRDEVRALIFEVWEKDRDAHWRAMFKSEESREDIRSLSRYATAKFMDDHRDWLVARLRELVEQRYARERQEEQAEVAGSSPAPGSIPQADQDRLSGALNRLVALVNGKDISRSTLMFEDYVEIHRELGRLGDCAAKAWEQRDEARIVSEQQGRTIVDLHAQREAWKTRCEVADLERERLLAAVDRPDGSLSRPCPGCREALSAAFERAAQVVIADGTSNIHDRIRNKIRALSPLAGDGMPVEPCPVCKLPLPEARDYATKAIAFALADHAFVLGNGSEGFARKRNDARVAFHEAKEALAKAPR